MRFTARLAILGIAALSVFVRTSAVVSGPPGIYAVITKVVLEPQENPPDRAQVWGAFAIANGRGGWSAPVAGYMYFTLPPVVYGCFTCPPDSERPALQMTLTEWSDMRQLAGTGQGVAFGVVGYTGRIRPASEALKSPEGYPIYMGLQKLGAHPVVDELKKALEK